MKFMNNYKGQQQKRKKTPTMLQMEATECGATSLSIILAYYNKYITSEEARIACGVSRDGTKAINIIRAARNYGMEAHGANLDITDLNKVNVPFIVYWQFNHFLVVEGYNESKVYLNDPATGPRSISWQDFESGYTGVVLEITPGDQFKAEGLPESTTLSLLIRQLGKNFSPVFFIILLTTALIIPKVSLPIFSKAFVDYLLIDNQRNLIPVILWGIGLSTVAMGLFSWFQAKLLYRLKMKLNIVNTVNFLWHLFHIPIRYYQQRSTGDIVQRNELSEKIAAFLAHDIPANLVGVLEIVCFALVIFLLSWQLGMVLIIVVFLNLIALQLGKRTLTDIGRQYAQEQGKLEGIETNGIQIIETLKVSGLEHYFFNRWIAHYTKVLNTEQKMVWISTYLGLVPTFLSFMTNLIMICFGAWLVMKGSITIGTIVAIQALTTSFMTPVNQLISFISKFSQLKGDIFRLNDVINTKIDPRYLKKEITEKNILSTEAENILTINNLSFSYSPLDPPTIDNLSLKVKPCQRIAIVGASGSGKSSLAKLICGLNLLDKGDILLNNFSITTITPSALAKMIAYVDQNVLFFPGNLRENLTLWDKNINDEHIYSLLKKVNLYEEVITRGGLSTRIVESGSNFSGGQCQRLEIVRALLRKPKLLILDEATSAMDAALEAKVYANLHDLDCTVVVIAHRLSAIKESDVIYVLNEGRIVEQGSHAELIGQAGYYNELVMMETF